ncbi:MAG: hypothetical protein P0S95_03280 [Rhabdochlamydiaceae bacterium]|nr:hypothetical protein [Candidatus Amphrikana amoebophyrae]
MAGIIGLVNHVREVINPPPITAKEAVKNAALCAFCALGMYTLNQGAELQGRHVYTFPTYGVLALVCFNSGMKVKRYFEQD